MPRNSFNRGTLPRVLKVIEQESNRVLRPESCVTLWLRERLAQTFFAGLNGLIDFLFGMRGGDEKGFVL